jgi:hypothetical protein
VVLISLQRIIHPAEAFERNLNDMGPSSSLLWLLSLSDWTEHSAQSPTSRRALAFQVASWRETLVTSTGLAAFCFAQRFFSAAAIFFRASGESFRFFVAEIADGADSPVAQAAPVHRMMR